MSGAGGSSIEGFEAPIHRALVEPILLGGAPRGVAILNGTLAAALGLGLQQWIAGLASGRSATRSPCSRPSATRLRAVLARHLRQRGHLAC
jgi:type IV secretory pathway TrbD component